jgi:hypothetical protein
MAGFHLQRKCQFESHSHADELDLTSREEQSGFRFSKVDMSSLLSSWKLVSIRPCEESKAAIEQV